MTLSRIKVADQLLVPASAILLSDIKGPTVAIRSGSDTAAVRVEVVASANGTAAIKPLEGNLEAGTEVAQY